MLSEPNSKRNNRERRIGVAPGRKHRAAGNIQAIDAMNLAMVSELISEKLEAAPLRTTVAALVIIAGPPG